MQSPVFCHNTLVVFCKWLCHVELNCAHATKLSVSCGSWSQLLI